MGGEREGMRGGEERGKGGRLGGGRERKEGRVGGKEGGKGGRCVVGEEERKKVRVRSK